MIDIKSKMVRTEWVSAWGQVFTILQYLSQHLYQSLCLGLAGVMVYHSLSPIQPHCATKERIIFQF
jgi:hypothetical protein